MPNRHPKPTKLYLIKLISFTSDILTFLEQKGDNTTLNSSFETVVFNFIELNKIRIEIGKKPTKIIQY